jgi:hypothetical protein
MVWVWVIVILLLVSSQGLFDEQNGDAAGVVAADDQLLADHAGHARSPVTDRSPGLGSIRGGPG